MYTDNRLLSFSLSWLLAIGLLSSVLFTPNNVRAEGSVDFIGYPGYRLFYFAERPQQLKVYASEGEFINFGASHVGISGGFIEIYKPDGSLHAIYNNTGTNAGLGIINNSIEELNGPTGGGPINGTGYTPGIVEVGSGEEGIWTVKLGYGFYQNSGFDNLLNDEAWTRAEDQPTNRRVVLSWDITVSQNAAANDGGSMLKGRVFTNEYQSIISENGNTSSPTFYLLTDEGFQFQIDYNNVDPWGFQIVSNNKGIISGDNTSTYTSFELDEVERSADIQNFDPASFYLYEPQARDIDGLINYKVFFNLPDPNMPNSAMVSDIVRDDTHTTWLLNQTPVYDLEIINVQLTSKDPSSQTSFIDALDKSTGAIITYETNLDGTAQLVVDLNNNGIFGDDEDRVVNQPASIGVNEIIWDGLDKNGQELDQQFNREIAYKLTVNAGELHLTLSDIENDLGGVSLIRLNGETPSNQFLYDHSRLGGAVSGGNNLPLPTEEPFTFNNNFGDLKMLDYWTYVASVSEVATVSLDIVNDYTLLAPDTDGDGVRDDSDLDDDNDGILDALEICPNESAGCFANNFNPDYDNDFDGIPNYADANDATFDLGCTDTDGDGRCDNLSLDLDKDQDGVPNFIDLDADNDGIFDVAETQLEDVDNDGFLYAGTPIVDAFGRVLLNATSNHNYITATADNDGDEVPNYLDKDSDNDGIHDIIESGHEDPEGDGVLSIIGTQDVNALGLVVSIPGQEVSSFTKNADGDLLPDYLDLDADNDGINDVIEGGNFDADNDGRIEGEVNEFGQVTLNGEILSTSFPKDVDGDGIPNYNDLDSDNDGLYDTVEGGNADPDNDGRVGNGFPDITEDGRVIGADQSLGSTSFPIDTDGDGIFDYEDLDSDGDGIFDVYEANLTDEDNDGTVGGVDVEVDENGVIILDETIINTSNPIDTDGDGIPDFRDLDSDNDTLSDAEECPMGAPCADVNQNGEPDFVEITPIACPIPLVQPTVEYQNSICDNEMLSMTVNESDIYEAAYPLETVTYTWTNSNGVVIATTTTPTFDIMGSDPLVVLPLVVKASVDVDCESEDSEDITPEIKPTPNVVASSNFTNVCIGGEVELYASDVDGAFYQWFFNTFPFSVNQNPVVQSLNQSTNFGVVATLNGCESERQDVMITADEPAVVEAILGTGSYCTGTDVVFTAVNNNPDLTGDLNYIFSGPNGLMVDVLVPADGTFEYTLTAVDFVNDGNYSLIVDSGENCVSNTESYTIDVTEGPVQPIVNSLDDSICPGEDILLNTQTYNGSNVTYTWLQDGATLGTTSSPSFAVNNASAGNAGNYAVQVDTGDGCGPSTSAPVSIAIVDTSVSPEIETNVTDNTACTGQTVNLRVINPTPETIYTWLDPEGAVVASGVSDFDIINVQTGDSGLYMVQANIDGCVTLSDEVELEIATGVETPELAEENLVACSGQNVEISITNFTTTNSTVFNWYTADGLFLTQTTGPSYFINNADPAFSGSFYVIAEDGECTSGQSEIVSLTINEVPSDIADAGIDETYCNSDVVNLTANIPSEGTGIWSSTAATISDVNDPFSQVSDLAIGENTFVWILSTDGCSNYSTDTVVITVNEVPNEVATIQNTQTAFCADNSTSLSLFADVVNNAEGQWTVASGPSALNFNNPNSNATDVTGFVSGTYALAWSLSTPECGTFSVDEYTVTISEQPTDIANAGTDASYCISEVVSLNAIMPSVGTGTWSNSSAVISDVNNPNAQVSDLELGDNMFIWVLDANGCEDYSRDTVVISVTDSPVEVATILNTETSICADNLTNVELAANANNESIGQWSVLDGPSTLNFTNPNEEETDASGFVPGTYSIAWTLSTSDCGVFSTDEYTLTVDELPSETANAGVDLKFCDGAVVSTNANTPNIGIGEWSSANGVSFSNASDPNTVVTGLAQGINTLTWTLSNGACENYSTDEINIEITTSPDEVAAVVNDRIRVCEGEEVLIEAIMPNSADGNWTQNTGPSSTFTDPTTNNTEVNYSEPGTYLFFWELSTAECGTFSAAGVEVIVDALPTETANAGTNVDVCGTEVTLNATMPTVGEGMWTSTVGVIQDPTNPNTVVSDLPSGNHTFTWVLSSGNCVDYASDEVMITTNTLPNEAAEIVNNEINLCANDVVNPVNLVAIDPINSTGQWIQVSGPNFISIDNDTDAIASVTGLISGTYEFEWSLSSGACSNYSSDNMIVSVDEIPANIFADAGADQVLCATQFTTLAAENPVVGSGSWSIFNTAGASVANIMDPNSSVNLMDGENIFVWSLSNGGCQNYQSDTISVFVSFPEDQAEIVSDNVEICESDLTTIVLEASGLSTSTGLWTQTNGPTTANIDNATNEQINITDLTAGQYSFVWTLSEGNCVDYASDVVVVNISELPTDMATLVEEEITVCDESQVILEAILPSQGIGTWTIDNGATIVNENSGSTIANNLLFGTNTFTWSLSNGNCIAYSETELNVFVEDGIGGVVEDNFTTEFETDLVDENLVANDNLNGNTDWTIELVTNSPEITLNQDGTFSFSPESGFSGDYTFDYELCDLSCGTCDRTQVTITVVQEPVLDCDVPNVLTPNNDNKNDALVIDCASQFDNNVIQIFNRWGDKVYEKETYQNDWRGTYQGADLPAGTYFYVFKKDMEAEEAITGFITIIR